MSNNTQEYYQYRARIARELALAAGDPKIAAIHMEMADRYEILAVDAGSSPLRLVIDEQDQDQRSASA